MRARFLLGALAVAWVLPCSGAWIFDGRPSTWEGGAPELQVEECTFPVVRLELGGQWTDFELKASTNNFASLVYYIKSSGPTPHSDDTNVWTYFTDDYAYDVRRWVKSAAATAIASQLVDRVHAEVEYVVVCPSHECAVDWRTWMSSGNSKLVWSFVRYDGIDMEKNATGTQTHWNPIVPVEWRTARVNP